MKAAKAKKPQRKKSTPKATRVTTRPARRPGISAPTLQTRFSQLKGGYQKQHGKDSADYQAGRPSQFRRTRTGLGGTGDAHYTEQTLWQIREYGRDMVRNDAIIGQAIERLVENIIGCGMRAEAMTDDSALNQDLQQRFEEWGSTATECDIAGRLTFGEMEHAILKSQITDGDVFVLPSKDDPWIQIIEGDRCLDPRNKGKRNIVHGVELTDVGRPIRYFFQSIKPGERMRHTMTRNNTTVTGYQAFDTKTGLPLVWHMRHSQRYTETRGLPRSAPVFDVLAMLEDVNFAKLVQQQVVSCMALIIERTSDMTLGPDDEIVESTTDVIEELSPGTIIKGLVGEKVHGFSPDVPNETYLDHVKFLLRLIGANLGLPLELMVFDVGDTTFHGHRANMVQARKGFQCHQTRFPAQFHRNLWQWKLRQWMADDKALTNALKAQTPRAFFRHRWHAPVWEYVDPLKDAQGDKVAIEANLTSPRRQRATRGGEWREIAHEIVEDHALMVELAVEKAKEMSERLEVPIDWHELVSGGPIKKAPKR